MLTYFTQGTVERGSSGMRSAVAHVDYEIGSGDHLATVAGLDSVADGSGEERASKKSQRGGSLCCPRANEGERKRESKRGREKERERERKREREKERERERNRERERERERDIERETEREREREEE
jgi:hypothetical protein